VAGELQFDVAQDPEQFCDALTAIKGVGDWTAQYVAMRALKNPDAYAAMLLWSSLPGSGG